MALLTAGYWPTTYWANSYWNPLYWPVYGEVSAVASTSAEPIWLKPRRKPRIHVIPLGVLVTFKEYLEQKLSD